MEYGICNVAIAPLRAEAAHRSEMVSQLLFGETFEIMERAGDWIRVMTTFDGYEGWLNFLQYAPIISEDVLALLPVTNTTKAIITAARKEKDNTMLYLPFGSTLPFYDGAVCYINYDRYEADTTTGLSNLVDIAYSFLNTPYLWGGRTHFGVDCSGYVQTILRTQGIALKRDARLQASQGTVVDFLPEARMGDLAFFDNAEGRIIHVGMMLDSQTIIHASGRVKIDQMDGQGIYSAELKRYTHNLRIVKRFF
jgi:cell wall-associated NlpC family hydrolase